MPHFAPLLVACYPGCARVALLCIGVAATCLVGCRSVEKVITPSNFRDWEPEQALLPTAEIQGNQVTIRNVRNCQYFANDVYLVDYYDKTFDLNAVRSVDFIIVPFAEHAGARPHDAQLRDRAARTANPTTWP